MPVSCSAEFCEQPAVLKRPKTGHAMCKECFFFAFETEIHVTIVKGQLFKYGYKVAIGASGGKDSTVLAYVLKLLNERYNYGLELFLLSIDEGITGYRDDSLETVKKNRDDYQLPLIILSYKDLYGWTMDQIVSQIGHKSNCTFCGVFRRQALDRGAAKLGVDMIVTGHNADDMAETVIMNILKGDVARLARCTNIITEGEGTIPRCKPLKYAYEKEIVMYAHYKKLVYFTTECIYSPNAYRGYTREYIKECERIRPSCILDIIHSGEQVKVNESIKFPKRRKCIKCGFIASQEICKACLLLEGLNTGMPKLGIGKTNKAKKIMGLKVNDGSENKKSIKMEPRGESKRKMRREEKKKKAFCKEYCTTDCTPKVSQLTSIDDVDISSLNLEPNFSEEQEKTETANDNSFFSSYAFSDHEDDKDDQVGIKIKKEKVDCKCAKKLNTEKVNTDSQKNSETDEPTNYDDDYLDMDLLMDILGINTNSEKEKNVEESQEYTRPFELKSQLDDLTGLDKKLLKNIIDICNDDSLSLPTESENLQSTDDLDDLKHVKSSTESNNLLSSLLLPEESQEGKSKILHNENSTDSVIDTSQHLESQLINSHSSKELSDESTTIVKANPRTIRPSLILPEMMHKASNNLDF